ncbi:hypothetical protein [Actinoplanes couchii]|uniref:Uncharacterized protein n=1 Tax=Actinoplanes couchii TaxID=403638 RepID=A0ABQ3X7I0_9ACTN|nr:hypothetical protein [Actinoplanes couchii]MDR6322213.1 hypothetical protein [Actinoplanes couchii]GID54375.1 hypothetical protein Aco03nite_027790 [Actinoplanes couchii]
MIRRTDWMNVTIENVDFQDLGDLRFRNGQAKSGATTCTMLPFDTQPAYGEYLAEEPANSPATEDALIVIECGAAPATQALIPVQLSHDGKARHATGHIEADPPTSPANRMLFRSYKIVDGAIRAVVQRTDGDTETRRYLFAGGTRWEEA